MKTLNANSSQQSKPTQVSHVSFSGGQELAKRTEKTKNEPIIGVPSKPKRVIHNPIPNLSDLI
jgi:hypothetical protein